MKTFLEVKMKPYILTIDQGTTSTRTIIFNRQNEIVAMAKQEIRQYYPNPGWVNQDANEIWLSVLKTMTEALNTKGISAHDIEAIGITNQRETLVVWDIEGNPLHHAIVWQSRQSNDVCTKLKDQGHEPFIKATTGLVLDPYFTGSKLTWLFEHRPELKEMALKGELKAGTMDSFIIYKLTGGVHKTDVSNASRTLLMNLETLDYDDKLLKIFGVPRQILPKIEASSHLFGMTMPYHFYGLSVPISGVAGDQQAALFGQACFDVGDVKNTYGTGCFMLMNTGNNKVMSKHGLLTTVAWKINDQVTYALEGSVFVAGSAVQWLRDGLELIEDAKLTESLATSVKSSDGVYVVPTFVGLGTPYWNQNVRGAMYGLTRGTTKAHLARATLEAICYQSMDVLDTMKQDANQLMGRMKVDGGATSNKYLLQFQSDIINAPIYRPKVLETTALGVMYLAALQTGYYESMTDIQALWQQDHEFAPVMEDKTRKELIEGWHRAIDATIYFSNVNK
jgi:glycerol kinase